MEDCGMEPTGEKGRGSPVNTWTDGIRVSMRSRNVKDEECFNPELWMGKIRMSFV
jgi:hypothetical protein